MFKFAQSLREWRQSRRFSQLDLSLEADVSARHISFLETGRARPSRDMISRLGAALHLPLSAQNALLTHAGFAARFPSRNWDHAEMAPIRLAIDHIMDRHALSGHHSGPCMEHCSDEWPSRDALWNVGAGGGG